MAANAIKILENDQNLKKFKGNALEVARKFDIKNILPLYEELYEKALKNIEV
jgi:glycosyltransferase involved in cell wall biosynthesis